MACPSGTNVRSLCLIHHVAGMQCLLLFWHKHNDQFVVALVYLTHIIPTASASWLIDTLPISLYTVWRVICTFPVGISYAQVRQIKQSPDTRCCSIYMIQSYGSCTHYPVYMVFTSLIDPLKLSLSATICTFLDFTSCETCQL